MNKNDSEFTNLTRAQVEALMECFDFLRNGYKPLYDYKTRIVWIIRLIHQSNSSRITVTIYSNSYTISRNGIVRKQRDLFSDVDRYRLVVHSDGIIEVFACETGGDKKLVSG